MVALAREECRDDASFWLFLGGFFFFEIGGGDVLMMEKCSGEKRCGGGLSLRECG